VPVPRGVCHAVLAVKSRTRRAPGRWPAALLTAALRRVCVGRATPPVLKLEIIMRSNLRSLTTKSTAGHIEPRTETFTSGFVRETVQGYIVVSHDAVIHTALELLSKRISRGPLLTSPRATRDYLRLRFADLQHEVFCLLYLDKRHRLIACEELFRDTIDGASVHPREVVKAALRHNPSSE
jgi:DNA repair protein RadC